MLDWKSAQRSLEILKRSPVSDAYHAVVDIRGEEDLLAIPTLSEANFSRTMRHLYESSLPEAGCHVFMSSGTTGEPKLAFQPAHQFIADITGAWSPLSQLDRKLLIDLSGGGKAWSANHFFRELALYFKFSYLHIGNIYSVSELEVTWSRVIRQSKASAISGNPTQLAFVASFFVERGEAIESVRRILWSGEPLKPFHEDVLRQAFPRAEFWSVYGGTEPWVIGAQRPGMGRDEYIVVPHQHVEVHSDRLLVTSLHSDILNPILRYEVADRVELLDARSRLAAGRIKVVGRSDQRVCLGGNNLNPGQIIAAVNAVSGVKDSQIIFKRSDGAIVGVEVRVMASPGWIVSEEAVRKAAMHSDVQNAVLEGKLSINLNDPVLLNERTGKCAPQVYLDIARVA